MDKEKLFNKVPIKHNQAMLDVARSYGLYEYKEGE